MMNIFVLDKDQESAARYHVDKHVVKMPLETAQLLCSAHHVTGTNPDIIPYRLTHKNHPSSIWTRESLANYNWLVELGLQICKEYTYRYEKIHKCEAIINWCKTNQPNIKNNKFTPFAQAMPDSCKRKDDAIEAYRNYYLNHKQHLFSWKNREKPGWIVE